MLVSRFFRFQCRTQGFHVRWISEQKPGVLDELAAERAALLTQESAELEKQAGKLAEEITELGGAESQIG